MFGLWLVNKGIFHGEPFFLLDT